MTTLALLDAAIYAALAATQFDSAAGPSVAAPFALVGRYAGELSTAGIRETCALYPAALLRWDVGAATRTVDAVEGVEDMGVESWTVLVALEEPREIDDAVASTDPLAPGGLALLDCVLGALNGLVVDELWRDRRVRVAQYGPAMIHRGEVYVYSARFETRRALPQAVMTTAQRGDGQALTDMTGAVSLTGTADPPTNPAGRFDLVF